MLTLASNPSSLSSRIVSCLSTPYATDAQETTPCQHLHVDSVRDEGIDLTRFFLEGLFRDSLGFGNMIKPSTPLFYRILNFPHLSAIANAVVNHHPYNAAISLSTTNEPSLESNLQCKHHFTSHLNTTHPFEAVPSPCPSETATCGRSGEASDAGFHESISKRGSPRSTQETCREVQRVEKNT